MVRKRIIPCLLLQSESLVKTIRFNNPSYIGDAVNTVRIFNELEVDELILLDIKATSTKSAPNFEILKNIASECFMPLAYGGGINSIEQIEQIFKIGFEKVILNTAALKNPKLISDASNVFGNQAIVVAIDSKRNLFGNHKVYGKNGKIKFDIDPISWAKKAEDLGAGELIYTSIEREGTWSGYDISTLKKISDNVNIPIIANGGAGSISHLNEAIELTEVSAVAIGSMVVYQQKGMGILINFPDRNKLNFE